MNYPYRYAVNCFWCEWEDGIKIAAYGISKTGHFACWEHVNLLLIAGLYDRPLPKMSASMKIMQEANPT